MYGGLACWFWLHNACSKISTDLVMPEATANIDWLNSLIDLGNNSFDWRIASTKSRLNWDLVEIHWEVFGLDLKHKAFYKCFLLSSINLGIGFLFIFLTTGAVSESLKLLLYRETVSVVAWLNMLVLVIPLPLEPPPTMTVLLSSAVLSSLVEYTLFISIRVNWVEAQYA